MSGKLRAFLDGASRVFGICPDARPVHRPRTVEEALVEAYRRIDEASQRVVGVSGDQEGQQ